MDQGLEGRPKEGCTDDIHIDDIREGVALLGEPMDVVPLGLAGLLLATLEVLGIPRTDICPMEISEEDPLEIHPVTDAIAFNLVIYEVMKGGGSVSCHPHEFGCERGRC